VSGEAHVRGCWEQEYAAACSAQRTGLAFEVWRDQRITQVAAGWVLACVFTRYCEDNDLLDDVWLAGPGERLAEARDRQLHFGRKNLGSSDLDYLHAAIGRLTAFAVTARLVDSHNPRTLLDPTPDAATALLEFWRRIDPESGRLAHGFTNAGRETRSLGDPNTRFLGDLYQGLSEQARKDYALLQTPGFVADFILDRTLEPAIETFGLAGLRLIDPTCGSGHFLLGAFARLLARWRELEPGTDVQTLVGRVLEQVAGVDINPYAAAIARFRLLMAALQACGIKRLAGAPAWTIQIATGDSLRFGVTGGEPVPAGVTRHALADQGDDGAFVYSYEDAAELKSVLEANYHAVVGNPPYITVKDPVLNALYRTLWPTCGGKYALSVPFVQRFFDLAVDGGHVGQITANSFMKREFGRKLIVEYLPTQDLSLIVDTSGAYIPGHGTPTVLLFGRHRQPVNATLRAVLGIRGEPSAPADPAKGLVWRSIVDHVDEHGAQTEYVTVTDWPRATVSTYPWSLSGGGASGVMSRIEKNRRGQVDDHVFRIGFFGITGADELLIAPTPVWRRRGMSSTLRHLPGNAVRDWYFDANEEISFPYQNSQLADVTTIDTWPLYWPFRHMLQQRKTFSGLTYAEENRPWWIWHQLPLDLGASAWSITFAFVATHNHFVLARAPLAFNKSAPVIKLPEGASEDDHLRLLGLLNSSTACFWLKQVSHDKGNGGIGGGIASEDWERFFEFTGTKLAQFPLPDGSPLELTRDLDALAQDLGPVSPAAVCDCGVPTRQRLSEARDRWDAIRADMISAQEELDWEVYGLYGLLDNSADDVIGHDVPKPPLQLGGRAFEIALARQMAAGEVESQWFARHGSTPITEMPAHWPPEYRALVQRRLDTIETDPYLHLIERPECKRRWATKPWAEQKTEALRTWLLDRLEGRPLWFGADGEPRLRTVSQLADELRTDADFGSVAALYARDVDLANVIAALVKTEHVPYLAACRYTDSGLQTRAVWERTWDLQRAEDRGEPVGAIPVPPKYKPGDFRATSYWRLRGKLDVPKERFTSYPDASRDGTLLLRWAGYDHLQRAQALATYAGERIETDSWDADRLTPLFAGLAELLPWVRQWHDAIDPLFGQRPADAYRGVLDGWLDTFGLTADQLSTWRPPAPSRGRRRGTKQPGRGVN
jgi:hypothetical protein